MEMSRTRIKMCGTTNIEDAECAILAGVDALGFIFFKKSLRNISPEKARKIICRLPPFVDSVGVFVDRDLVEVVEIVEHAGLTHVQLHGEEDSEYCKKLALRLPSCKIIKAFRVGEKSTGRDFLHYNDLVTGFLLDTYVKDKAGGTGEIFDWRIVDKLDLQRPVIVAGGLTPENVTGAIEAVQPFAIDINSGVEIQPGVKDHGKLLLLVEKVRQADKKKSDSINGL